MFLILMSPNIIFLGIFRLCLLSLTVFFLGPKFYSVNDNFRKIKAKFYFLQISLRFLSTLVSFLANSGKFPLRERKAFMFFIILCWCRGVKFFPTLWKFWIGYRKFQLFTLSLNFNIKWQWVMIFVKISASWTRFMWSNKSASK